MNYIAIADVLATMDAFYNPDGFEKSWYGLRNWLRGQSAQPEPTTPLLERCVEAAIAADENYMAQTPPLSQADSIRATLAPILAEAERKPPTDTELLERCVKAACAADEEYEHAPDGSVTTMEPLYRQHLAQVLVEAERKPQTDTKLLERCVEAVMAAVELKLEWNGRIGTFKPDTDSFRTALAPLLTERPATMPTREECYQKWLTIDNKTIIENVLELIDWILARVRQVPANPQPFSRTVVTSDRDGVPLDIRREELPRTDEYDRHDGIPPVECESCNTVMQPEWYSVQVYPEPKYNYVRQDIMDAKVAELRAENEKLKEQLTEAGEGFSKICDQLNEIKCLVNHGAKP